MPVLVPVLMVEASKTWACRALPSTTVVGSKPVWNQVSLLSMKLPAELIVTGSPFTVPLTRMLPTVLVRLTEPVGLEIVPST